MTARRGRPRVPVDQADPSDDRARASEMYRLGVRRLPAIQAMTKSALLGVESNSDEDGA